MKRFVSLLLTFVCVTALLSVAVLGAMTVHGATELFYDGVWHTYTGNLFALKVDGKSLSCEVPPIVFNDYSVVPARDVFEHLGAEVGWNSRTEQVTVNYGRTQILMTINQTTVFKDGQTQKMPIAPKIINGKTMIPVRYVSEALGFDVNFDSKTDTISITTKKTTTNIPTNPSTSTPAVNAAVIKTVKHTSDTKKFTAVYTLSSKPEKRDASLYKEPDRLVVDLYNTTRDVKISDTKHESDFVTQIRYGQHEDKLRIVFDLTDAHKYSVSLSGTKLTVTVEPGKNSTNSNQTDKNGTNIDKDYEKDEDDNPNEDADPSNPAESEIPVIEIDPSRSITIDPGHGGSDPGAVYTEEDGTLYREADINLAVALKVRDILEANGVHVVMTRTKDVTVELRSRPELANSEKTALFLSVHTNSVEANEEANGFETWGSLETGRPLAGVTDKSFASNVQRAVIKRTGAKDRGLKDSVNLAVLKYSAMPSVLVEVGFITNQEERSNMFNDSYRDRLARGIAEGILETFDDMGV